MNVIASPRRCRGANTLFRLGGHRPVRLDNLEVEPEPAEPLRHDLACPGRPSEEDAPTSAESGEGLDERFPDEAFRDEVGRDAVTSERLGRPRPDHGDAAPNEERPLREVRRSHARPRSRR